MLLQGINPWYVYNGMDRFMPLEYGGTNTHMYLCVLQLYAYDYGRVTGETNFSVYIPLHGCLE